MIKISKRLEAISGLVPIKSNIIDIGCDHALLDIYLYQKNIVNKIIVTDINKNALNNAIENIKKANLEGHIETRLGNGLDTLTVDDDIDTIVISGMGAHTIIGILKNNLFKLRKINTIVTQSNTKIEFLRREMTKLHYYITDELLIEDNHKVYTIIKFEKGNKKYTKKELYFGPILLQKNTDLFKQTTKKEFEKLRLILKLLPKRSLYERYKIIKEMKLYKF